MSARLALAAAAALLALAAGAPARGAGPGEVPVGGTLREAPLYGLTLDYRRLSDFRGKPLVINVWASWCGPCRDEMGSLDRLARRHNGREFHVIGVSTDDHADKAQRFVVATGVSFDNYHDRGLVLEAMLGADRIPLTVLVDARGKVLRKVYGARDWTSPGNRALVARTLGVNLD
ncbi:MAG: TlpA family protein disulfide reductase [Burkholderiales bacterium]